MFSRKFIFTWLFSLYSPQFCWCIDKIMFNRNPRKTLFSYQICSRLLLLSTNEMTLMKLKRVFASRPFEILFSLNSNIEIPKKVWNFVIVFSNKERAFVKVRVLFRLLIQVFFQVQFFDECRPVDELLLYRIECIRLFHLYAEVISNWVISKVQGNIDKYRKKCEKYRKISKNNRKTSKNIEKYRKKMKNVWR